MISAGRKGRENPTNEGLIDSNTQPMWPWENSVALSLSKKKKHFDHSKPSLIPQHQQQHTHELQWCAYFYLWWSLGQGPFRMTLHFTSPVCRGSFRILSKAVLSEERLSFPKDWFPFVPLISSFPRTKASECKKIHPVAHNLNSCARWKPAKQTRVG